MSQASTADVLNVFKKVYGNLQQILPEDYPLQKDIPFNEKQKVGESYNEAVVLTYENGFTLLGNSTQLVEINPAIAGSVQQATVTPYATVLASVIPWQVASRAASQGEGAFYSATKFLVKNNLRSHGKLLETLRLYGQNGANGYLGYVSYYTGTYRGAAFTNGTGSLTINGSAVAFTNGINVAEQAILFQKGYFAAGVWTGSEGTIIQEVNAVGTVVKQGKVTGVDVANGVVFVDFIPTAASSTTSHRICYQGMTTSSDMIGIVNILTNTGSLFGIQTGSYDLWKGNVYDCNNGKLTLDILQKAAALAVNRGGLDGDLVVYMNPRSWARLSSSEAALRMYDESYSPGEAESGFETLKFHTQTGTLFVKAHRFIQEGLAIALHLDDWSRSGSAEISFKVPGMNDGELMFPLQNQNGYAFRSYSDQYIFCHGPAKSILFTGIDDEAA
jgi:hypothetical protein